MKTKDIVVGQTYEGNDCTFLGCGDRKMWTDSLDNTGEMIEKFLVVLTPKAYAGLRVKVGRECCPGFWDDIKPQEDSTESQKQLFIRGWELGNSNQISLPDALETEFGK